MIDVFISTCAEEPIRVGMAQATIARWSKEKCNLTILAFGKLPFVCNTFGTHVMYCGNTKNPGPYDASERNRRFHAEEMSKSDIYVLADDDILPLQKDFLARGEAILRAHPDFGKICLYTIPDDPKRESGSFQDEDVYQVHGGGGVRFIRKGIVEQWAPIDGREGYDAPHCREFYKRGFKVGYFKNLTGLHIGWGHTTGSCGI